MKKVSRIVFAALLTVSSLAGAEGGYVIGKDRIFEEFQRIGKVIYDQILKGLRLPGISLERLKELLKKLNILEIAVLPAEIGSSIVIAQLPPGEGVQAAVPGDEVAMNEVIVYVDPERWAKLDDRQKIEQVLRALLPADQIDERTIQELTASTESAFSEAGR